jgi:hypothetical protein
MISTTRRISVFAAGGAGAGLAHGVLAALSLQGVLSSLCIGIVTGAVAGTVASISAPKFMQGLLTGAAAGLCAGILSFYFLGSEQGVVDHTLGKVISLAAGGLVYRYVAERFGQSSFFAPTSKEKTKSEKT